MQFDICFLDPPYTKKMLPDMLSLLVRGKFLAPGAIVVCESEDAEAPTAPEALTLQKHVKYGRIYVSIFHLRGDEQ